MSQANTLQLSLFPFSWRQNLQDTVQVAGSDRGASRISMPGIADTVGWLYSRLQSAGNQEGEGEMP